MRKLATGYRLKRFKELLPGLDTETLFTDYPNVLLMDLKKVSVESSICDRPVMTMFLLQARSGQPVVETLEICVGDLS